MADEPPPPPPPHTHTHQHTNWSWIGPPFWKRLIGPWSICMLAPHQYGLICHLWIRLWRLILSWYGNCLSCVQMCSLSGFHFGFFFQICEEMFVIDNPHIDMFLEGVDIIANPSGSHHELRKLHIRAAHVKNATARGGGIYLYANQRGCDGGRLFFDSSALIAVNGEVRWCYLQEPPSPFCTSSRVLAGVVHFCKLNTLLNTVSSCFEERKMSEPGRGDLNFRLRS